eukprot:scpid57314/ scgid14291/ 
MLLMLMQCPCSRRFLDNILGNATRQRVRCINANGTKIQSCLPGLHWLQPGLVDSYCPRSYPDDVKIHKNTQRRESQRRKQELGHHEWSMHREYSAVMTATAGAERQAFESTTEVLD